MGHNTKKVNCSSIRVQKQNFGFSCFTCSLCIILTSQVDFDVCVKGDVKGFI